MTTQFSVSGIELTLCRYPSNQESNLQAWDAADEHLVKTLFDDQQATVKTMILNDGFGALCAALLKVDNLWPVTVATDAKTSMLGSQQNLQANALPFEHIQWQNSRAQLPANIELVLMKVPKNLGYFTYQLKQLSQVLPAGTKVLIGAKAKTINSALLERINANLGPANASLTYKKTRVITCISDGISRETSQQNIWKVPEYQLEISNLSNVFANNKLDIGARIMLENMPQGEFDSVIDLGCGNGVLGLRAAQLYPNAHIHFVDDSEMAIASAQHNWQFNNAPPQGRSTSSADFHWDDCMTHLPDDVSPDLVLCNPPFHQGDAITDHIAWQMFLDARRRLKPGGILHIVGNRHLAYHVKLKRLFKNCTTVASNGKFVILQSVKQG